MTAAHIDLAPACPNCGRPMALISAIIEEDQNTFTGETCKVSYITDDHVPITGLRRLNDNAPP